MKAYMSTPPKGIEPFLSVMRRGFNPDQEAARILAETEPETVGQHVNLTRRLSWMRDEDGPMRDKPVCDLALAESLARFVGEER